MEVRAELERRAYLQRQAEYKERARQQDEYMARYYARFGKRK
jgi:hypothetical protein